MPKMVDAEAKREQILAHAARVFAQAGYRAATMAQVAAAAGVSKGSVYDYYRSKEELFFAVADWHYRRLTEASRAAVAAASDPATAVRNVVAAALDALAAALELYPLTLEVLAAGAAGDARARFAAQLQRVYADHRQLIAERISAGQAAGQFRPEIDAQAVAAGLVGAVDGFMLQQWLAPEADMKAWAMAHTETLLRGLAAA